MTKTFENMSSLIKVFNVTKFYKSYEYSFGLCVKLLTILNKILIK